MNYRIFFVTVPNEKEASVISRKLLEEKIVACVNRITQVQSMYWWEGKIEESAECLLIMKTAEACSVRLIERVKELHSYDVPEIISFEISAGNPDYLSWIDESISCTKPSSTT